jgi:hypothetical protein
VWKLLVLPALPLGFPRICPVVIPCHLTTLSSIILMSAALSLCLQQDPYCKVRVGNQCYRWGSWPKDVPRLATGLPYHLQCSPLLIPTYTQIQNVPVTNLPCVYRTRTIKNGGKNPVWNQTIVSPQVAVAIIDQAACATSSWRLSTVRGSK